MIKAVIIEDETQLRETNRLYLQNNFTDIQIVGEAATVNEAIQVILETKPHLVLLDIELADGNCFQVLQKCKPFTFKPIFITAYNQYAIKAIKFSAIDYLLKPVNEHEFCNAVQLAIDTIESDTQAQQTENFRQHYTNQSGAKKIVLRTSEALHVVAIHDILYCKSDNSYTTFFIQDGEKIMVSKSMKEYADLLSEYRFIRPHQSYLVNIDAISKIDKSDGGFVIMKNGKEIPISSRRKQLIFDEVSDL